MHTSFRQPEPRVRAWMRLLAPCVLAILPAASGWAAGAFDSASAKASTGPTQQLSWNHVLGGGANRIVVVGVTIDDRATAGGQPRGAGGATATVTFNGVPLLPVAGGMAVADGPRGPVSTQLFYLLDASLPAQGTYAVAIQVSRTVERLAGGSTSLRGLAQAAAEAVAVGTATDANGVSTSLTTLTPEAWIVDAVSSGNGNALRAVGAGQLKVYGLEARRVAAAGSAQGAGPLGAHSLSWMLRQGRSSLAQVAASFAPVMFPLTVQADGLGTVTPPSGTYLEGAEVTITATAAPRSLFAGWSGAVGGEKNPVTIVMDAPKSVTATFKPDFLLYGWATTNGGTTGGAGGQEVVVDTLSALRTYTNATEPYIIKIFGTITGNETVRVRSNKSILGIGNNARLLGVGLQVGWNSEFGQIGNVIIRNVTFEKALAPIDGVMLSYGAKNVWIDHCNFLSDRDHGVDFYDGLLDINHAADFITVSWSRFYQHYKTSLVGNSDDNGAEDAGHLTVTYHHNSWVNSGGRNPSVRFGLVHTYNNDYRDLDDYAIASRMGAQVVVENNFFTNVIRPIRADTSLSPVAGSVSGENTNTYVNCGPNSITGPPATWVPPYETILDPVASVPATVQQYSGVGVVVYEGDPPPPTPPTISIPPASQTVTVGDNVDFAVLAEGSAPLSYQWSKDLSPIGGAVSPLLSLTDVQFSDAGSYTVTVSNVAGSVTSDPAILTVEDEPPPPTDDALRDHFTDGERVTQALPDSAAWFTSSGSNNLVASVGELRQIVTSSRTFLAYFSNDTGTPVTLSAGQTLTLGFGFRFTGFDSAAPVSDATFRVGLLRSVANPVATSGTGFVANGPPNTNARVIGDFGSNNPGTNAFSLYSGYAAFTSANATGTAIPIRFYGRTGSAPGILNSTTPFTQIPLGSATPSVAMEPNVAYRGTLTLQHTGTSIVLTYSVRRVSDDLLVMSHSVEDTAASMTAFDTVAFYQSKNAATPNYDFILTAVDVALSNPPIMSGGTGVR